MIENFLKESFFIYTEHPQKKTDMLKDAFEQLGVRSIRPEEYQEGHVILYGKMRGLYDVYKKCLEKGYDFLYIDNGYLKKDRENRIYFRILWNKEDVEANDIKDLPSDRLEKFSIHFEPWKNDGELVLLIPPSPFRQLYEAENSVLWIKNMEEDLKRYTTRKIYVKNKFSNESLSELIDRSYAICCHSSTVGLEALIKGKKVICNNIRYFLSSFVLNKVSDIEKKMTTDRNKLFCSLSYYQFTLDEIAGGVANSLINELQFYGKQTKIR